MKLATYLITNVLILLASSFIGLRVISDIAELRTSNFDQLEMTAHIVVYTAMCFAMLVLWLIALGLSKLCSDVAIGDVGKLHFVHLAAFCLTTAVLCIDFLLRML